MKFNHNIIVNSLWIGDEPGAIELLTLYSFIDKGHHFKLWLYEPLKTQLPKEVEICDANQILPREKVFVYKNKNSFGHGKGSVAGFSDIFRYKLLYEKGGWWVDMDVTCLKPLDFEEPYYFREHHDLLLVGNVMKCPVHSELMSRCYEEAARTVNETNTDWHKPIDILNYQVTQLGLEQYIRSRHSNIDRWEKTNRFILTTNVPPADWYFVHWQNEEWKYRHLSKTSFYYRSFLAKKLEEYKVYQMPSTYPARLANNISRLYNWIINLSSYIIPMLGFNWV
jgi:hypothetical protein